MPIKHYTKITDFTKDDFLDLFKRTDWLRAHKKESYELCKGKVLATLFFQPSTKTSSSFQSGMIKLGGGWIGISGIAGTSVEKGESFEDTVECFSRFSDIMVIRHPDSDAAERSILHSQVPIVNGGCGTKEHPGAYLFVYPVYRKLKETEKLKFGIYGTPGINRVSKSLLQILGMFGVEIFIDDLEAFPLPSEVEEKSKELGAKKIVYDKLENFISKVDINAYQRPSDRNYKRVPKRKSKG